MMKARRDEETFDKAQLPADIGVDEAGVEIDDQEIGLNSLGLEPQPLEGGARGSLVRGHLGGHLPQPQVLRDGEYILSQAAAQMDVMDSWIVTQTIIASMDR